MHTARKKLMGRKLYVGNLGFDVTNQELEDEFKAVGACESVSVITERDTGRSRGFAFVEMVSEADAQKAIQELDGREVKGRAIRVSQAQEGGGRGGGGNRGGRGGGFGGRGGGGGGGGGRRW
jgi:RNA recognition motif-containing protein